MHDAHLSSADVGKPIYQNARQKDDGYRSDTDKVVDTNNTSHPPSMQYSRAGQSARLAGYLSYLLPPGDGPLAAG